MENKCVQNSSVTTEWGSRAHLASSALFAEKPRCCTSREGKGLALPQVVNWRCCSPCFCFEKYENIFIYEKYMYSVSFGHEHGIGSEVLNCFICCDVKQEIYFLIHTVMIEFAHVLE